jgi:hypothetical protein
LGLQWDAPTTQPFIRQVLEALDMLVPKMWMPADDTNRLVSLRGMIQLHRMGGLVHVESEMKQPERRLCSSDKTIKGYDLRHLFFPFDSFCWLPFAFSLSVCLVLVSSLSLIVLSFSGLT